MKKLILPEPSEKQKQFISDLTHKFLAFGGSRGGGKSFAVRLLAIILCYKFPGIKIMIVRKTYPELEANHITPLVELLNCYSPYPEERFASYNDSKKIIKFPNGSTIRLRAANDDRAIAKFQGTETDVLFVDEATHFSEDHIKKLTACVRGVNSFPKLIRFTCNPGNEGHAWVRRLFVDRRFEDGENPEDYAFIQSSVYDNKALLATNEDYVRQLEALPGRLRDMWLYGRWDIAEGMVFTDLRIEPDLILAHDHGCDDDAETLRREGRWTHVIDPFDISKGECRNWKIIRSYDFGYSKPFSCAWWAIDHEGTYYRILELYGCTDTPNEGLQWSPDQQFAEISRIEHEHPWLKGRRIDGIADPAIWDASRGESIVRMADKYRLYFRPGDHARIAGLMQIHYRLQFNEDTGRPRMYIFSNCKAFIRTMPLLTYDEHKVEDVDTDLEDHVCDEVKYAVMDNIIAPMRPVAVKKIFSDPLDQMKDLNERRHW